MADKTIKHFVLIRFFPWQDPRYPYDVFDVDFLSKQLILAKNNALSSLENQTNKNFELVFLMNGKFFSDLKYDFMFKELQNATLLPLRFVKFNDRHDLIKEAMNEYEFVITSKIDFDDFIFKNAVADTQSKVEDCDKILAYGYCKGYTYFNGDLAIDRHFFNGAGHIGILQSLILKSSSIENLPLIDVFDFPHHNLKNRLEEFLKKNGIKFSENMFQQHGSENAYIYFRSEFSHNNLVTSLGQLNKFQNIPKVSPKDITKKQLEEDFGFFYDLNSIK